jgi:hypothetical protein
MTEFRPADIFLSAFKNCVNHIIKSLPADTTTYASNAATTNAIQIIAAQMNGDFTRLQYVIEVLQARICVDSVWASGMAVKVYELLATSINPNFSHPDPQMSVLKGAVLVRDQMIRACQTEFTKTMTAESGWSRGLIVFLGQMCTVGNITSTTPKIVLHVLDCMLASPKLTDGEHFDIFLDIMLRAGPFLDSLQGCPQLLTTRLQKLQECTKEMSITVGMAVYGVLQLREKGWQIEESGGVVYGGQQVDGFTFL